MLSDQIKNEIDSLTLSEKLLIVEDIWDSIAAGNNEIPLHEWQKKELDRRYQQFEEGKLQLHDWKSVHEDLREKYR